VFGGGDLGAQRVVGCYPAEASILAWHALGLSLSRRSRRCLGGHLTILSLADDDLTYAAPIKAESTGDGCDLLARLTAAIDRIVTLTNPRAWRRRRLVHVRNSMA